MHRFSRVPTETVHDSPCHAWQVEPEVVELLENDTAGIVERMTALAERGAGWLNVVPAIDPEDAPPSDDGLFGIVAARGPMVPECTWTPPAHKRGRVGPALIGIRHPAGTKAARQLADAGHAVPDGWNVTQDHPRRGLVVAVPASVDHATVLAWLLEAARALTPLALPRRWFAELYVRK